MPRINGTTNHQSAFLRSLIKHPDGPPPSDWPSPVIFRRWLRKPGFRSAMATLRRSIASQRHLELFFASLTAAKTLRSAVSSTLNPTDPPKPKAAKAHTEASDAKSELSTAKPQLPTEESDTSNSALCNQHSAFPLTELNRRLCNDILRSVRPRSAYRAKRPPVVLPIRQFDSAEQILRGFHPATPLGIAIESLDEIRNRDEQEQTEKLCRTMNLPLPQPPADNPHAAANDQPPLSYEYRH